MERSAARKDEEEIAHVNIFEERQRFEFGDQRYECFVRGRSFDESKTLEKKK